MAMMTIGDPPTRRSPPMAHDNDRGLADAVSRAEWLRAHERAERTAERLADRLVACIRAGGRILTCGNGGSMCDAMHFAEELSGRYRKDRRALPAQAMSDPAHLTCAANDWGFDKVFARGVEAWGHPGDTLIVFSTSGNSPNLLAAAAAAKALEMDVLGLLGGDGGPLKALCDLSLVVPGATPDRIQEVHMTAVHLIVERIERELFPENYSDDSTG
jgi:D-sedoheptulose 7-phosphate isomerase